MASRITDETRLHPETRLVTAGRQFSEHGFVNPAVYHASTVLCPDVASFLRQDQPYTYGRRGTPTMRALETALARLDGAYRAKLCPSGLAAITTLFLAFAAAGDHVLVADTVYRPAREFCDGLLRRLGVETTYYDPLIGAGIGALIRSNTRLVYAESPGSQTMEVQDIPAIAEAAHRHEALLALDNTWASGRYFQAFAHGADLSIQAGTKYIVGHADAMLGTISCTEGLWRQLHTAHAALGQCVGPDDIYLGLRGLRTLDVRLERHMRSALEIAEWLRGRPEVAEVLHPALPGAAGHELWKRDFLGASGLFSVVLQPVRHEALVAMLDGLALFGIGGSWGGFESLVIPFDPTRYRSATRWRRDGPALRFHIGLEHPDDLKADLADGFKRLAAAG